MPDSAHGTNPASAALNGYEVVSVASGADGILHPDAVAAAMDEQVAALMVTNPNTLGLFERHIAEICEIVHAKGGLVYGDGANLNALLGIARPGDMGIDVMHFNLHKTFSTPHGGGGPGAGPVAVKEIARAVPARAGGARRARRRASPGTTTCRARSGACTASTATSACWCAPTPTSSRSAPRACAAARRWRC